MQTSNFPNANLKEIDQQYLLTNRNKMKIGDLAEDVQKSPEEVETFFMWYDDNRSIIKAVEDNKAIEFINSLTTVQRKYIIDNKRRKAYMIGKEIDLPAQDVVKYISIANNQPHLITRAEEIRKQSIPKKENIVFHKPEVNLKKSKAITPKSWCKQDDIMLLGNIGEMNYEQIGKMLGRTKDAITNRVFQLKRRNVKLEDLVPQLKSFAKNKPDTVIGSWSVDEDQTLISMFTSRDAIPAIATKLNRTKPSVESRYYVLKSRGVFDKKASDIIAEDIIVGKESTEIEPEPVGLVATPAKREPRLRWTNEQNDQLLRMKASKLSAEYISQAFGNRTVDAVKTQYKRLTGKSFVDNDPLVLGPPPTEPMSDYREGDLDLAIGYNLLEDVHIPQSVLASSETSSLSLDQKLDRVLSYIDAQQSRKPFWKRLFML